MSNTTDVQKSNRDIIEECLHALGVHDGFPNHRRSMAVVLDLHAVTPEDVQQLAEVIASQRRKDSDGTPAILAKLLSDPKATKERLLDIRRGQGLRKAPEAAQESFYPGRSMWKEPGADDGCGPNLARHRRIAYALLKVEKKPATVAAEVIGCTPEQAIHLANEHLADMESDRKKRAVELPGSYITLASGLRIRAPKQ